MAEHDEGHGPGGGEPHLPRPTIWPVVFAGGIALLLIGVSLNWVVFGIGVGVAAFGALLWAREAMARTRPVEAEAEVVEVEPVEEEAEPEEPERFGRNVFLERTTLGLGALIGVGVTAPVVGFAVAPTFIGQGDKDVDLGPITNFKQGQFYIVKFTSDRDQGQVSRRTAFIRYNGLKNDEPSFTIMSSRCVHLGCPIEPSGPTGAQSKVTTDTGEVDLEESTPANFVCPCHGGAYDTEGNRISGPPVRALDRYRYKIVDGNLVLTERFSVGEVDGEGKDAVLKTYTRLDPGQHVDGPDAWMYPVSPRGI